MSKLLHEITRESDVGIWGDQTSTARIYDDKIIVGQPYVKWADNSGNLDFRKVAIRDQKAVGFVLQAMADIGHGRNICKINAWDHIQNAIDCIDFSGLGGEVMRKRKHTVPALR